MGGDAEHGRARRRASPTTCASSSRSSTLPPTCAAPPRRSSTTSTTAACSPFPLEEVARGRWTSPSPPRSRCAALKVVQSLEPAGVGARDLVECLLLQIGDDDPDAELKRTLHPRPPRRPEAQQDPARSRRRSASTLDDLYALRDGPRAPDARARARRTSAEHAALHPPRRGRRVGGRRLRRPARSTTSCRASASVAACRRCCARRAATRSCAST